MRLAAKLTGWRIDILSESEYEQERQKEREQEIEAAIVEETRKLAEETVAAESLEAEFAGAAAKAVEASAEPFDASAAKPDLTNIEGVGPRTARAAAGGGV